MSSLCLSNGLAIIQATSEHVPAIQSMVRAAYSVYVERIGKPPAPMTADYDEILTTHDVYVLQTAEQKVVGSIVLGADTDATALQVNNLVVDPNAQGRGYGRLLMAHAEETARKQGCSAVTLYTNAKMYENLQLYPRLGFVETGRRRDAGYDRVYFRKELS